MSPPQQLTLDDLNKLNRVRFNLGESVMNVGWDGPPRESYVRQLWQDAQAADDMLTILRDRLADELGAVWETKSEQYVEATRPRSEGRR